ncbi:hypothetical protein AFLA_006726 [Aspergillus flavus NRRL3357]|nr:hypothetical protein AFLA_006726 [Aspergillus flavus NRRL3357]
MERQIDHQYPSLTPDIEVVLSITRNRFRDPLRRSTIHAAWICGESTGTPNLCFMLCPNRAICTHGIMKSSSWSHLPGNRFAILICVLFKLDMDFLTLSELGPSINQGVKYRTESTNLSCFRSKTFSNEFVERIVCQSANNLLPFCFGLSILFLCGSHCGLSSAYVPHPVPSRRTYPWLEVAVGRVWRSTGHRGLLVAESPLTYGVLREGKSSRGATYVDDRCYPYFFRQSAPDLACSCPALSVFARFPTVVPMTQGMSAIETRLFIYNEVLTLLKLPPTHETYREPCVYQPSSELIRSLKEHGKQNTKSEATTTEPNINHAGYLPAIAGYRSLWNSSKRRYIGRPKKEKREGISWIEQAKKL